MNIGSAGLQGVGHVDEGALRVVTWENRTLRVEHPEISNHRPVDSDAGSFCLQTFEMFEKRCRTLAAVNREGAVPNTGINFASGRAGP